MAVIYLSLGSNVNRHHHITAALDALQAQFGELAISPVYESKSVGFDGSNFFNLVVGIETDLPLSELNQQLKHIEDANGRKRNGPKFSPRTLDIDILTYDDHVGIEDGIELPRAEITQNAFVLLPLSVLAPEVIHPVEQRTYASLWTDYNKAMQPLWPIDFLWRDQQISQSAA